MADVALTLKSERWLDEVVFEGDAANVGADVVHSYQLPAGIGDVALMEAWFNVSGIATMVATPENLAISATIQNASNDTNLDIVGVARVSKISATALSAYLSPDPLVIWRQNEQLTIQVPEVDTNVAPTDDHKLLVKCVRVRPIEAPATPLQLVR